MKIEKQEEKNIQYKKCKKYRKIDTQIDVKKKRKEDGKGKNCR